MRNSADLAGKVGFDNHPQTDARAANVTARQPLSDPPPEGYALRSILASSTTVIHSNHVNPFAFRLEVLKAQ